MSQRPTRGYVVNLSSSLNVVLRLLLLLQGTILDTYIILPPLQRQKKKKITINLDNPLMFQAGDIIQCEKDVQVLRNNGVFIKTWHFKMLKTSIEGLNAVLGSRELTLHAADRLAKGVPFLCCPEWKLSQNSTSRSTISHGHLMLDCTPRQIHKMKRRARTEPSHIIRSA